MTSKLASHRSLIAALVPIALAVVGIAPAHAQPGPSDVPEDPYDSEGAAEAPDTAPQTAPPAEAPPAPPANLPPAPLARPAQPVQAQPAATGQWVNTTQYGWIWMPYGNQYVYSPEGAGAYPSAYVYAPSYGWSWLSAPWVWGIGPRVYFSVGVPYRFGWYGGYHRGFARGFVGHGYARPVYRGGGGYRYGGGHVGGAHISGGHISAGHVGGAHVSGGHTSGGRGHR